MTCFSFVWSKKLDPAKRFGELEEELSGVHSAKVYSYKELKIATDDFSVVNKIGEGGFGSVFKVHHIPWNGTRFLFWKTNTFFYNKIVDGQGKLKNGDMVAIKVLSAQSTQGTHEFLTEMNVISDIEHKSLVQLCGCCIEGNQRILVYEYLENNSLAQTLLGTGDDKIQFSWRVRTRICIAVARGLAFLHEEVRPYIVHRDIKASNILLDKNLKAKISDFGLAKLIPPNMTHISTRVAGTIGYLAPEYAIGGKLTRKADIYSFGVLLMEIVCGRCNTNTRLSVEEQYLLERIWNLYEKRELVAVVDTFLNGEFDAEEACKFLKIGLLCTQDSPKLRPSMSTVVKMLTGEMNCDDRKITKPGLILDFMDLKIKTAPKPEPDMNKNLYSTGSSGSNCNNTTFSSKTSSQPTKSFTSILD